MFPIVRIFFFNAISFSAAESMNAFFSFSSSAFFAKNSSAFSFAFFFAPICFCTSLILVLIWVAEYCATGSFC